MAKEKVNITPEEIEKRKQQFADSLLDINKKYQKKGEDTVISFLDDMNVDVERFSSGSLTLDNILGGGFPKGRIIEIYGAEASGKTSIALTAIGNVQKEGGNAVFIDAEQALDPVYASILGVDIDKLGLAQVNVAEEVFNLMIDLVNSGSVDLIVLDSVASLIPRQEEENDMDKNTMALLARIMSRGVKALVKPCRKNNASIIFLNQTREKVGLVFGNPVTTTGGNALKFYASQRIQVNKTGQVKGDKDEIIGTSVKFKCVKNKVARPFGEATSVLTFAKGINRSAELKEICEELGIIIKKGQTYFLEYDKEIAGLDAPNEDGLVKIAAFAKNVLTEIENNKELYDILASSMIKELSKRNENAIPVED